MLLYVINSRLNIIVNLNFHFKFIVKNLSKFRNFEVLHQRARDLINRDAQ